MHSELHEATTIGLGLILGVYAVSFTLFKYWGQDFKFTGETGTRKQLPTTSNVHRMAREEKGERGRSQPTLSFPSDDQLTGNQRPNKKRLRKRKKLNSSASVECDVLGTPRDCQRVASSGNQFVVSRKRTYCCQELDLASQKGQPHVQAILQNNEHDWETIAAALVYLHKHNALVREADIVLKAIYHMQDLSEVPGRGYTKYMGYRIPRDYSQHELRGVVQRRHRDMKMNEFEWVYREFVQSRGYPPTPYEFSRLFEKCIETVKLRKLFDKLREEKDELERRLEKKQRKWKESQKEVSHLNSRVTRALCKICLGNEVAVVYQPCEHAVVCRACHEHCVASKTKRARTCLICNIQIKSTKNLILA